MAAACLHHNNPAAGDNFAISFACMLALTARGDYTFDHNEKAGVAVHVFCSWICIQRHHAVFLDDFNPGGDVVADCFQRYQYSKSLCLFGREFFASAHWTNIGAHSPIIA